MAIKKIKTKGVKGKKNQEFCCALIISIKLKEPENNPMITNINPRTTSYEII